jgi:ribosome biogenesis GTPase A
MRVKYSFSSRRTGNIENIRKQKVKFPKLVGDMIRTCDIILEVLDARFINDTRNPLLEEAVKRNGKKLIYVLNKSDLVEINEKKKEVKELGIFPYVFVSCKKRAGTRDLRERIKIEVSRLETNYLRAQVGVIGYPNAGKSSLINVLTGKAAARTAAEAGFTRGIQKIRLSKGILILDTPGVIPDSEDKFGREPHAEHAEVGARSYDKVKDPEFIIHNLFMKNPGLMKKYYNIEAENSGEFLERFGKKKGLLLRGGEIDLDRASRLILKDWQKGNIKI